MQKQGLLGAVLQDLFGIVVADRGLVVEHFEVGVLAAAARGFRAELADGLLHAGIVQFALPGGLAANQLVDGVADDPVAWPGPS